MTSRRRLTGRLRVAAPPDEAFRLFTARGEQEWVPGWRPQFPAPVDDDTAPGTVFQTDLHGRATTWTVVDSVPGRSIRYARVTAGLDAGTVTVALSRAGRGSEVTFTYDITALTDGGAA